MLVTYSSLTTLATLVTFAVLSEVSYFLYVFILIFYTSAFAKKSQYPGNGGVKISGLELSDGVSFILQEPDKAFGADHVHGSGDHQVFFS